MYSTRLEVERNGEYTGYVLLAQFVSSKSDRNNVFMEDTASPLP